MVNRIFKDQADCAGADICTQLSVQEATGSAAMPRLEHKARYSVSGGPPLLVQSLPSLPVS